MVITNDGKQNTEKYLNILKIIKKQGYRLICQTSIYIYKSKPSLWNSIYRMIIYSRNLNTK